MSPQAQEPWYSRLPWLLPWAIIVALLYFSIQFSPTPIPFRDFNIEEVIQILTGLAMIALFVERALEVFVTTWRGPGATDCENQIADATRKLDELKNTLTTLPDTEREQKQAELVLLTKDLQDVQTKKAKYKSHTQRLALWTSLILGSAVSLVGMRCLEPLVNATVIESVSDFQRGAFHVVDVLLTGGLIAGGSDGIHKITAVFTEFFEKTRTNIKNG